MGSSSSMLGGGEGVMVEGEGGNGSGVPVIRVTGERSVGEMKHRLMFRYMLGRLGSQLNLQQRHTSSRDVGRVLVRVGVGEGETVWKVTVEVLNTQLMEGTMLGRTRLQVCLEHEGTQIAPRETEDGGRGRKVMRFIFHLGGGEISNYFLTIQVNHTPLVGRRRVTGSGVVSLQQAIHTSHPLWLPLHCNKAPQAAPQPLSAASTSLMEQELREAAIAHAVTGHPRAFFSPQYGNKVLTMHCKKLRQSAQVYVHHGLPE